MRFVDRMMIVIASLQLILLSLMAYSNCVGGFICVAGDWLYRNLLSSRVGAFALEVSIILTAVYLLELAFRREESNGRLLRKSTETGDIYISVRTIEAFAKHLAEGIEGVKDVSLNAKPAGEGIDIVLRVVATKDAVIPEMASRMEARIREGLPAQSGFNVNSVKTFIRSAQ